MKKSAIKKILLTFLVMFSIMATAVPAFAVDEIETGTTNKIEEVVDQVQPGDSDKTEIPTVTAPSINTTGNGEVTTIPAFFQRIQEKFQELVVGTKSILQPVVILCFFVSAFMAILGAISKKGTVMPGIIGCIVCCIAWTVIENAEFIFQTISHWLGS